MGEFSGLHGTGQEHIEEYEAASVLHEVGRALTNRRAPDYLAGADRRANEAGQIQYLNGIPCLYGEVFYSAQATGATLAMFEPLAAEELTLRDKDIVRCTLYSIRFDRSGEGSVLRNPRLELIVTPSDETRLPRVLAVTHDVVNDRYSTTADEWGMSQRQLDATAQIIRVVPLAERVESEEGFYNL